MSLFPQQFIEDLRLHANIVQIVQEHVPLKRAGTSYKGLCPFHSEKTPSFTVNPDKGFFHCFGCHASGDVFKFLSSRKPRVFRSRKARSRRKPACPCPKWWNTQDADGRRDAALRETMLKLHELAAEYFRESLASPAGARARQQLADRRISRKNDRAARARLCARRARRPEAAAARARLRASPSSCRAASSVSARTARSSIAFATG